MPVVPGSPVAAAAAAAVYSCWSCGQDFEATERDGLTDDLEVACPGCGSDLVAVDIALSSRRLPRPASAA
jgi:DNA-directed RNA polymerase subunit RPC12/RpoP